jgi:hypothetical protein
MTQDGHVACTGEQRSKVKLKERDHFEDRNGDGRIILKLIFTKEDGKRELE